MRVLFAVVLLGFASSSVKAQATFDFPLEVGNVWVYKDYEFPLCIQNGCYYNSMEVIEQKIVENVICGIIEDVSYRARYVDNSVLIDRYENVRTHEYMLCQVDNKLYWYSNPDSLTTTFRAKDMIADFDRSETQPWVVEAGPYDTVYSFAMRRLVNKDLQRTFGPYGYVGYEFQNYLTEDSTSVDGIYGGEFVSGYQDFFTDGIGFPVLGWGGFINATLIGYAIDGQVTGDTTTVWATSIDHEPPTLPAVARLTQAYPNPFNPSTEIGFQMSVVGKVRLSIHDLLGREVAVLVDEVRAPGAHQHTFDAAGLPSGIYLVVLDAAGVRDRRNITLLR